MWLPNVVQSFVTKKSDFTNGKDFTTCDIAKHILAEEEEHEQDLQDYLTDIVRMKKSFLEK